jgi:hypothetical protein
MPVQFSQNPGRHERHYRRRLGNPLFAEAPAAPDDETLLEMQRLDHEELLAFITELRATVRRAIELEPNEESDVILGIKERLDRLYEVSAGLAEDHSGNQAAIRDLVEVIMRNVERGAAGDPQALDELAQERIARAAHFDLLATPLVADLLHPQSVIAADELAPTLLSASEAELNAALQLFDVEQLSALQGEAVACLERAGFVVGQTAGEPEAKLADAAARLSQIAAVLAARLGAGRVN